MAAEKVRKFEEFLNERLRYDLQKCMETRDKVSEQIAQYMQLKTTIEHLIKYHDQKEPLKTKVDLGCNFYMQARVDDPSKIFINIGLGIYLEFPLPEATVYIDKRLASLNTTEEELAEDASKIKAHIKLVLEGLRELQNISAEDPKQHRPIW